MAATFDGDGCSIDLSKITPFKWRKLFVFNEAAQLELIEKAMNRNCPYWEDVARRLVFLDENGEIAYHEDVFPGFDGVESGEIVFDIPDSLDSKVYTNPKFVVKREATGDGYYCLLSQQ